MSETTVETVGEGNVLATSKNEQNSVDDSKQDDVNDSLDQDDEPSPKKAKLSKDNNVDSKIGKDLYKDKNDDLRSTRDSKASMKRISMMAKTAQEGEALLKELGHKDENPDSNRRRTRSQTRGTPAPTNKSLSKQQNEDTPKRSRRGRPRKEEKTESEESQEVKNEEMNSTEEKEAQNEDHQDGPQEEEEEEEEEKPEAERAEDQEDEEEEEDEEEAAEN